MTEETKKPKRPPIGSSIPAQFQSFGSSNGNGEDDDEELKGPATQVSKRPAIENVEHSDIQTSSSPAFQQSEVSTIQQSSISKAQASSSANVKKSKHPDWKQQTVYLPPTLLKWLRVQAPQEEREISEIVTEALENYRRFH